LVKSSAADVSARIDGLIERCHGGDHGLAAIRLGIEPRFLVGLLSGDWRQFSLDALAAVIRTYGVTIDWLLGSPTASHERLTPSEPLVERRTPAIDHQPEIPRRSQ
jgi:hypothetical protein